ncbi:MAG: nucleotidyltransferase domain-containing protein [Planctomycetota bacterium]
MVDYFGFAETQWRLVRKDSPLRVKPLLYLYRVLLTDIHLMKSGEVNANLPQLNGIYRLPYIDDLLEKKIRGTEKGAVLGESLEFHRAEYERLKGVLQEAFDASRLPDISSATHALDALLMRVRLASC